MYFKQSGRINPRTNQYDSYYRLVESYRNAEGRICHRTILNIGFIEEELSPEQLNIIARTLTDIYQGKQTIFKFEQTDDVINNWEITRIGNTQKVISTSGYNIAGKEITVRKCSEPQQKLAEIQEVLQIKSKPFTKLKSVVHKPKLKKIDSQQQRAIGPG